MQDAVPERRLSRRRRTQVQDLFDPEGSLELWSEVQSPGGGAFDSRDWCNLAFDSAHWGHLTLLRWLISTKKVPILIQNRKGCNLLHAAASFGQEQIAEWLLDREENSRTALVLFRGRSKRGRTPLEIAVRSNRYGMVDRLLEIDLTCPLPATLKALEVIRHCCRIAGLVMKNYLSYRLRTMEIKMFFFDLTMQSEAQSLDEILPKVAEYSWWENRKEIEWNEHEQFAFYITLRSAAKSRKNELIKWLLDEWNVSLKPPSLFDWKGLSIADVVAMGNHQLEESILNNSGNAKSDEELRYDSKKYFDMVVSGRWEDGQCSSLIPTLEPLIYKKGTEHYFTNRWFEALREQDFESRLEILKIFAEKYEVHGAESFALPRLDLVIAYGQLHILKWLISSEFVNLNLPLSSNEEILSREDDEGDDNEVDNSDDDDDNCAICYRVKRFPLELQCGHSYCISCIRQVHIHSYENTQGFQCPYCRRHLVVPPSMTISSSLQYYLASESPWLPYQSSNTIGEILMALAAGTGSVFILEYLITQHNIDPLATLYANGRNLMHIAASRPNLVSCKWLCFNGYLQLATRLSDQSLTPILEAINNSNYAASLVFDLFIDHKVVPDNWIELAATSPNADIVHTAEFTLSHGLTASIPKLLAANAPLDQLIGVIDKSTFGKHEIFDEDVINSQFEFIVQFGRADVLIWLYNSDIRKQWYLTECRQFIRRKIGESVLNRSAMEAFMDDVDAAEKLSREIAQCNQSFGQMIVDGAPVFEIEQVIDHQKELIEKAHNLNLKMIYWQISFDEIIVHGLNSLETAVHHGHLHLINWILQKPNMDIAKSISQIFSQAIQDGNLAVFQFVLSWLDDHNQPLPNSIQMHREDRESLLHAIVSLFAVCSSFMSADDGGKVWKACFEMAQLLIDRPDVDVNALNERCQTPIYHLAGIVHFKKDDQSPSNSAEVIGDRAFELIQMLVNAGTDLNHIDADNKTFFEKVLDKASPLLIKAIRWLALEKGVNIQFVRFSCFDFDRGVHERVEAEFKAIREEQRLLQLQQR